MTRLWKCHLWPLRCLHLCPLAKFQTVCDIVPVLALLSLLCLLNDNPSALCLLGNVPYALFIGLGSTAPHSYLINLHHSGVQLPPALLLLAAYRYGFDDDFFSNWRGSVTFVCFDLYVNFPLDREDDSAHQLQEEKCKATRSKCFQTCLHSHLIFVPIFTQPHRYLVFPSLSSDSADNHVASPTPVPDGGLEPAAQAPSLH